MTKKSVGKVCAWLSFPLRLPGPVGELAEHAAMEAVFGLHGCMDFPRRNSLAHLFIVTIFNFSRLHFQAVDFFNETVIVLVCGICRKASFLEFPDFPIDAPLFVVHLMKDGEESGGFRRSEAGFAHDETFQVFDEILWRERPLGLWLCRKREDDGTHHQAGHACGGYTGRPVRCHHI